LIFIFLFIGLGKHILRIDEVLKGFVPLLLSLLVSGGITFIGWKLLLEFYPQYQDILHKFTYNGHDYIYAFTSLSIAICFLFYQNSGKRNAEMNQFFAPLFLWLLLNVGIAIFLKGAGFLIIPVISSALMLGIYVLTQKSNWLINCILAIPTLVILPPFIQMFPVGLGLKILYGSTILTVLTFGLLIPIVGSFPRKGIWSAVFFLLSIGLFVKAHQASDYTIERPKPNSLVYLYDADTKKSYWTTYDVNLDEWTKGYLGEKPKNAETLNTNKLYSKYGSKFTFMNEAPNKNIAQPTIEYLRDTLKGNQRLYQIKITPNRAVNRYDIFNANEVTLHNLVANGAKTIDFKSNISGSSSGKILSYYVVNNEPLVLSFSISKEDKLDLNLVESSFDLLTNPQFTVTKRKDWMISTPFVLNNAIVIRQKIKPTLVLEDAPKPQLYRQNVASSDSLSVKNDSLR
jgi:hypothetical protein